MRKELVEQMAITENAKKMRKVGEAELNRLKDEYYSSRRRKEEKLMTRKLIG